MASTTVPHSLQLNTNVTGFCRRKKSSRRGICIVRAQYQDNHDPNEAQRPLGSGELPRFFAVDGNPPTLEQDWRAVRAQLVAQEFNGAATTLPATGSTLVRPSDSWAHTIPHPEPGCLLVARHSALGMFSHSVVFVLEHSDTEGTSGLLLNMPTPVSISSLGLEEDITGSFGHCPLFIGGPITRHLLHVLHGRGDVDGARRVVDGIFVGGVEGASELVRLGLARPEEFRLMAGYSGWGPHQLANEIAGGSWWVVATSHNLILECLQDTPEPSPKISSSSSSAGLSSSFLSDSTRRHKDAKTRCWEKVLDAAGIQHEL